LGLIREDPGIKFSRIIINGNEQILSGERLFFVFEIREPLGIKVNQFSRIRFIITPDLLFALLLQSLFNFAWRLRPYFR